MVTLGAVHDAVSAEVRRPSDLLTILVPVAVIVVAAIAFLVLGRKTTRSGQEALIRRIVGVTTGAAIGILAFATIGWVFSGFHHFRSSVVDAVEFSAFYLPLLWIVQVWQYRQRDRQRKD